MVESADLGQRNDAAVLGQLDGAWLGRILLEREVRPRAVVVAEVAVKTTTEVSLIQDDHVVEELAADGADHPFDEGILPGRAWCSENLGDEHALHPSPKLAAVDAVSIPEYVARRRVIGERLDNLLRRPGGSGGIGDVKVHELAAMMHQDHEHVEYSEGRGRNHEEVDGDEIGEVILEERAPGLRGWLFATRHESGNGALRDVETELEQLAVNAWRAPERVRQRHGAHEIRKLQADPWSTHSPATGLPGPESAEALPVPANHGLGANEVERLSPPSPLVGEPHPEEAIEAPESRSLRSAAEQGKLLPKRQVL